MLSFLILGIVILLWLLKRKGVEENYLKPIRWFNYGLIGVLVVYNPWLLLWFPVMLVLAFVWIKHKGLPKCVSIWR